MHDVFESKGKCGLRKREKKKDVHLIYTYVAAE